MGWKATGTWRGHYSYDPAPQFQGVPDKIGFVLRLRQSWFFGSVTGDLSDELLHGMPDLSTIEGQVSGDQIEFVKRLPVHFVWLEGRLTPLAEYLAAFGHQLEVPPQPMPLLYSGQYQPATDELVGTWKYGASAITTICDGQIVEMDVPAGGGRWTATRSAGK